MTLTILWIVLAVAILVVYLGLLFIASVSGERAGVHDDTRVEE